MILRLFPILLLFVLCVSSGQAPLEYPPTPKELCRMEPLLLITEAGDEVLIGLTETVCQGGLPARESEFEKRGFKGYHLGIHFPVEFPAFTPIKSLTIAQREDIQKRILQHKP